MRRREFRHTRQQFDLNILFGAEVGEESAFRHPHLIGQDSEGDSAQARLAHQREPLTEDAFAG